MLELAKSGYSKEEIIKALHSNRQVNIKYNLLNKYDIKIGKLDVPSRGSGRINVDSQALIKRTANFLVKENEFSDIDWLNDRIQPVFQLEMPRCPVEWSLGIFLISSPTRKEEYGQVWRSIEAYDPNLVLKEDKFISRYIVKQGSNYVSAITEILNSSFIHKINIPDNLYTVNVDKEFSVGSTKIEAINSLLKEINYTSLFVDTNGYYTSKPYVLPVNRKSEYTYKTDSMSIIHAGATNTIDLFDVPNVWIVTASNPEEKTLTSIYTNDSPTSKTSVYTRNRNIVKTLEIDSILNQITLNQYTKRVAFEDSQVYEQTKYSTAKMPHHTIDDLLYIEHTKLGTASNYIETSWNMDLSFGGKMTHQCRKVVNI